MKIKIRVFCGVSVEAQCSQELHPINQVKRAAQIVAENKSVDLYSNSHDFVSAIYYACQRRNIECELFLNGISKGKNLERIFKDFNRCYKLIDEL